MVTPENLYEVLKGISGAVTDLKNASLRLNTTPAPAPAPVDIPNDNAKEKGKKKVIDVVLGAQWGDEGKGKLVDMLSQVRVKFIIVLYFYLYVALICANLCSLFYFKQKQMATKTFEYDKLHPGI